MTEERFRAIVESYGADPARWPHAELASAMAVAAAHPAWLAEAAALDAALALDVRDAAPSEALRDRIVAAAASGNVVPLRARPARFARVAAALAACAVVGVALGFLGAPAGDDATAEADAAFGAAFNLDGGEGG